jgi:acetyl-CoA C-acetyltransferase
LDAGLSVGVTGLQIDRRCGSGLQAVLYAAMQVECGISDLVIAGGVESMNQAEFYTTKMRWGARGGAQVMHDRLERGRVTSGGRHHPVPGGMLETAENVRREYGISRDEQDAMARSSHQRAVAAQAEGRFDAEVIPVTVSDRKGRLTVVTRDEHPRDDVTLESLAALAPMLRASDPDATVTAGNASGQNDGAAACIVTSRAHADHLGLRPLARLLSCGVAGVRPDAMGIGPVPATAAALARADLRLEDMDLIEVNEAFASQVLACTREWGMSPADFDRLNVNGSGISLGHPVGATGGRILATLLREMERRGARFGLETMCIGGGQGLSAVFERLRP